MKGNNVDTIPFERYQGRTFAWGAYGAPTIPLPSKRTVLLGAFVAILALLWFTGVIDHQHALMGGGIAAGMGRVDWTDFEPTPATKRLGEDLAKTRADIKGIFDAAKSPDGYKLSAQDIERVNKLNDEAEKQQKEYAEAERLDKMAFAADQSADKSAVIRNPLTDRNPGSTTPLMPLSSAKALASGIAAVAKSIRGYTVGDPRIKIADLPRVNASMGVMDVDGVKTLMTLSDIAPQADRQPGYTPSAQFLSDVTPLFAQGTTDSNVLEFELETTYTSNAQETAEGTANTDAALSFTNTQFTVREINEWIPVGRQTLNDNAGLLSYIQSRLLHMLDVRRSSELMAGNGSGSNITGVINFSGIQSQARGTDDSTDAIFKAITLVQTTGDAQPSAVVIHAQNWQTIRLLRTDQGLYIWGQPSEAGPMTLFGLPVKVSNSVTQNTAVVGAFDTYAQIFYNGGTQVEVSTEHSTYFTERKAAILAAQQLALVAYRGSAFCKVTGLN